MKSARNSQAVFVDRDGTILRERGYLSDPRALHFYPRAIQGLKILARAGYKLVVVTNQSGVGRGYFSLDQLRRVNRAFTSRLRARGVRLAGLYFCPHLPGGGCACRKPRPGMAMKARAALGLDLKKCYVIGDQDRDMSLARAIGARGVLVLTGAGRLMRKKAGRQGAKITSDLKSAALWIRDQHE